jgi:hypothetical protein
MIREIVCEGESEQGAQYRKKVETHLEVVASVITNISTTTKERKALDIKPLGEAGI